MTLPAVFRCPLTSALAHLVLLAVGLPHLAGVEDDGDEDADRRDADTDPVEGRPLVQICLHYHHYCELHAVLGHHLEQCGVAKSSGEVLGPVHAEGVGVPK